MAAILFKAYLVDDQQRPQAEMARILYGVESLADKEQAFRNLCSQKYPQLQISEPLHMSPAGYTP